MGDTTTPDSTTPTRPPGKGHFPVPAEVPPHLMEIGREFSRTEERARYSAQGQIEAAKSWRKANTLLGGATSVAGAAAAVLTFGSDGLQVWAGISAIAAAILAAVMTTVAPERRTSRAQQAGNAYLAIQTEARQYLLVHLASAQQEDAVVALQRLSQAMDETNRSADPPGKGARDSSKNVIESGGQVYGIDET